VVREEVGALEGVDDTSDKSWSFTIWRRVSSALTVFVAAWNRHFVCCEGTLASLLESKSKA
jgi:hypothetical protein